MNNVIARQGSDQPLVAELDPQPIGPTDVRVAVTAAAFTYFDAFLPTVRAAMGLPDQVGLGF
ncbi:MAG: hypothetical protein ACTHN0_10175, partial [Aquihabitans sp.]